MNSIQWSKDNLSELGFIFLRKVLENMRGFEKTVVVFGETGIGKVPNYQTTYPNGVIRPIHGRSHDNFKDAEKFNSDNTSIIFTYEDIVYAKSKST